MPSLETFQIRFGRAEFCCAVGFRPHIGIKFEPIAENISVPLTRLNAETTSANLATGRSITYSTTDNVQNSNISLQLLERNDFDEFQKIATAHFALRNGRFEGSVWFISHYDRTFELGTIDICAKIDIKNAEYDPLSVKKKSRGRKKTKSRPKTAVTSSTAVTGVLDVKRIQKDSRVYAASFDCADVGALSNPPPLFYRSAASPISAATWQSTDTARIIEKLTKSGTEVTRVIPPKPRGDARLFNVTDGSLNDCPLVTQIIDELNSINAQFSAARGRDSVPIKQADAIRTLKEYNRATSLTSPLPMTHYEGPTGSPCPTEDDLDNVSVIPVVTRRLPVQPSRSSLSLHRASSRIRQDVHSGTYDRNGRPTLKPVFSGIFGALVDTSVSAHSLVSARSKHSTTQTEMRKQEYKKTEQEKLEQEKLEPEIADERKWNGKCVSTQTEVDTSLRQQTVLSVDIRGGATLPPKPLTPTPRYSANHSSITSLHISLPSVASETVTSMSQTSIQYSDDFTDDESDEIEFEKSRSEKFQMVPQRSKSPQLQRRSRHTNIMS